MDEKNKQKILQLSQAASGNKPRKKEPVMTGGTFTEFGK